MRGLYLTIREPPVHATALFNLRIDAAGWNVPHRGHNQVGTVFDESPITCVRERKSVHAESRSAIACAAWFAVIVANRAGRGEEHETEFDRWRKGSRVSLDQLAR